MAPSIVGRTITPDLNVKMVVGSIAGHHDRLLCRVDGYLDNANTPRFLAEARKLINGNVRILGLDLKELTYISSTGVGALSTLTMECKSTGKYFFLTGVPDRIGKVLNLLGFWNIFNIIEDPDHHDFTRGLH